MRRVLFFFLAPLTCACLAGTASVATGLVTSSGPTVRPWNGTHSTGDWSQYNDCAAGHVNGNFPSDYAIDSSSAALGTHACASEGLPGFVHTIAPPAGFTYAGRYMLNSFSGVRGQAGLRTLDTLWPSNTPSSGRTQAFQGANTWYRDEMYVPSSFLPQPNSDFNFTYEIHNAPDGQGTPMLSCGFDTTQSNTPGPYKDGGWGSGAYPERYSCRVVGGGNATYPFDSYNSSNWYTNPAVHYAHLVGLKNVPTNRWIDMVWNIRWDWRSKASGGQGYVKWWINGTLVATYTGPTLLYVKTGQNGVVNGTNGGNQGYMQHGFYTGSGWIGSKTDYLYHAATELGPTAASVGKPGL
jgi:hypothetical protein